MSNARVRHKRRYRAAHARFYAPSIPPVTTSRWTCKGQRSIAGYQTMRANARRKFRKRHPEFAAWLRAVGGVWTRWRAGLPEQMKER